MLIVLRWAISAPWGSSLSNTINFSACLTLYTHSWTNEMTSFPCLVASCCSKSLQLNRTIVLSYTRDVLFPTSYLCLAFCTVANAGSCDNFEEWHDFACLVFIVVRQLSCLSLMSHGIVLLHFSAYTDISFCMGWIFSFSFHFGTLVQLSFSFSSFFLISAIFLISRHISGYPIIPLIIPHRQSASATGASRCREEIPSSSPVTWHVTRVTWPSRWLGAGFALAERTRYSCWIA